MRKYNLRCGYCGSDRNVPYFFLVLRLVLFGGVFVRCKCCGRWSDYVLVSHIVHDSLSVREKEHNRIEDNKRRVWKNG